MHLPLFVYLLQYHLLVQLCSISTGSKLLHTHKEVQHRNPLGFYIKTDAGHDKNDTDSHSIKVNFTAPINDGVLMSENTPPFTTIGVFSFASNRTNSHLSTACFLLNNYNSLISLKEVDSGTFKIVLSGPLDREMQEEYLIRITCDDGHRISQTHFMLHVQDANDNSPIFSRNIYQVHIACDAPVGSVVISISAMDVDLGENGRVRYSLTRPEKCENCFYINSFTGVVTLTSSIIDCDSDLVLLHAIATDFGDVQRSSTCELQITVENVAPSGTLVG